MIPKRVGSKFALKAYLLPVAVFLMVFSVGYIFYDEQAIGKLAVGLFANVTEKQHGDKSLGNAFKQLSFELSDIEMKNEAVVKGHPPPNHQCNLVYHPLEDANCQIQTPPSTPSSCRPNYFIAGTRKGGTTSLHTYMATHPLVYPYKLEGRPQDGESFAKLDGSKAMYNTFVKNLDIPDYQIVGDSTVSRFIDDGFFNFAQHSCPDSKILLLLRDPVERCYSQMLMRIRLGTTGQKSISKNIKPQLIAFQNKVNKYPEIITKLWQDLSPMFGSAKNCMYEGAYVVHLRRLLHNFPKERVRIYWTDDFLADPSGVLRDALKFVGVNPDIDNFDAMNVTATKYNTKSQNNTQPDPNLYLPMDLREEMAKVMRPFDEQLVKFLGDVPPWSNKMWPVLSTVLPIESDAHKGNVSLIPPGEDQTMGEDENAPKSGSQKANTTRTSSSEHQTPIWMYWKQGWDHLSSIEEGKYKVDAKCVMGMKKMHDNTNFTLKLVTDANIDDYAPTSASLMKNETLSIIRASLWSDLVRIELLYRHGGIWADTSVCPLVPFGNVIDKYLDTDTGYEHESFFAPPIRNIPANLQQNVSICHLANPMGSEFRLASTWFMAVSSPGNSLIYEWHQVLMHHMTTLPNPNQPYFLSHCSLTQAVMYNETVAKMWQSAKKRVLSLRGLKSTPMPCFDDGKMSNVTKGRKNCSLVKKPTSENVLAFIDEKYSSL